MAYKNRDTVWEPTKDLSGVRVGKDFWPEIRWGDKEVAFKHSKITPWGQSRDTYHTKRGWK